MEPALSESHPPRRKWGQNFLIDPNITRKILDAADIHAGESILEIGPGRGILTKGLIERGAKVTAIEIDRDLIKIIEAEHSPQPERAKGKLILVQGDALDYPYNTFPGPYKVVANLPYNISSPILFRLLNEKNRISRMVLMLQKEVAERINASHKDKAYGALSIRVQYNSDVKKLFTVSPNCFRPRPKVSSAVIKITALSSPRISVLDEPFFFKVVKGAFQHRRKSIVNALSCAGFDPTWVKKSLDLIHIDPSIRGEILSINDFGHLADTLLALRNR